MVFELMLNKGKCHGTPAKNERLADIDVDVFQRRCVA